jgi:hypothetical protein
MSFQNKYLKYKNKYLDLKNKISQTGGSSGRFHSEYNRSPDNVYKHNVIYKKYRYLQLSNNDIQSVINGTESEYLKRELKNFVKIYYLEDITKGLPVLVSINPDFYAEQAILPTESDELKIKIKKVHILFRALHTGNEIFFDLINHYWSKFRLSSTNQSIIDIWRTLPTNYKNSFDLLYNSINEGFFDIFQYLCHTWKIHKDPFYWKNWDLFKLMYEKALYLSKENRYNFYKILESFFMALEISPEETKYGTSRKMDELCIFVHRFYKNILGVEGEALAPLYTGSRKWFEIPEDLEDDIYHPEYQGKFKKYRIPREI